MERDLSKSRYHIPILAKGMEVIERVAASLQGLTLQELVDLTGHSKTSVYRIACSLEEMGYLRKTRTTGVYSLTRKIFGIGLSTLGTTTLLEHAYHPMRRLRDALQETVVLGTLMDSKIVILEQLIGSHHFSFILKPGMGICLHASAPGKVFLANIDENERIRLLETIELTRFTASTLTSLPELAKELQQIRTNGYAIDRGEELSGVRCIGAPVFNQAGKVAASVWISGPAERVPDSSLKEKATFVMDCALEISEKLGFTSSLSPSAFVSFAHP
ncbi:MAG: IclR family transcriptional regulator [Bacteroidales bacterium]